MDTIFTFLYPAVRLIVAGLTVWYSSRASTNYRYFSGLLSAVLSGFLTYVFLEPLFVPVGLDLAMVAMWVLATYSALVGMSLGVLLPTLFPGLCFGVSLALLAGSFLDLSNSLYLPVAGGVCALVGAILSSR